jgi:predicted ATP-binding protein involved in virulence
LINFEEWILQLYLASKNGVPKAQTQINRLKAILGGKKIFPDVIDFEVVSEITDTAIKNYILFHTDFGKVRLQDLGYGYQSMLSWLVDFMYRMFLRYPESENPLAEPAIVLLDEIDLHLHPDWQRKIIGFLSDIFKKTQFIVTTHSPLILQSAENINVVILEKDQETANIKIHQPERTNFQAWTIEEILDDLMGMRDKILSEEHKQLLQDFNEGLEKKEYAKAKKVYEKLSKMLHPDSPEKKLLRLQMTSIPRKK